jgi:hypothetical protein
VSRLAVLLGVLAALAVSAGDALADMPEGCSRKTVTHHQPSFTHATTMFEMHLRVSVCYRRGQFTQSGETCWIDHQDPILIQHSGCDVSHYYYGWRGNARGGYYAQATATFSNCIFHWGCLSSGNLTLMVWATANGAFSADKRTN